MQPWLSEADDNDTVVRPDHLRRRLVQGGPVPSWLKGRRRRAWPGQQIIFTVCECCSGAYRGRTRGPVAAHRAPTYSRVQTRLHSRYRMLVHFIWWLGRPVLVRAYLRICEYPSLRSTSCAHRFPSEGIGGACLSRRSACICISGIALPCRGK